MSDELHAHPHVADAEEEEQDVQPQHAMSTEDERSERVGQHRHRDASDDELQRRDEHVSGEQLHTFNASVGDGDGDVDAEDEQHEPDDGFGFANGCGGSRCKSDGGTCNNLPLMEGNKTHGQFSPDINMANCSNP